MSPEVSWSGSAPALTMLKRGWELANVQNSSTGTDSRSVSIKARCEICPICPSFSLILRLAFSPDVRIPGWNDSISPQYGLALMALISLTA